MGRFHLVYSVVNCVPESVTLTASVLSFCQGGAVGLSVLLGRVVKTADLVDGVGRQRGGRGGHRPDGVISDVLLSIESDSISIFGLNRSGGPILAEVGRKYQFFRSRFFGPGTDFRPKNQSLGVGLNLLDFQLPTCRYLVGAWVVGDF